MQAEIIRSDRKTISVEVTEELKVKIRAPKKMSEAEIKIFIDKNLTWIYRTMAKIQKRLVENVKQREVSGEPLSETEIRKLAAEALKEFPSMVKKYADLIGVTYGRITIRNQKSRWGSCSFKGNLNFNCLLMLAPVEVREYVAVHELCHRKEMNHSPKFWREVEKILPDYRERKAWLDKNGGAIMKRMTGG